MGDRGVGVSYSNMMNFLNFLLWWVVGRKERSWARSNIWFADVVDPEDRYKYIDDLSVLQLILLSGLHILKPWNLWINFTGIFFPVPCVNTNRSIVPRDKYNPY